jgi:hypothetical protein
MMVSKGVSFNITKENQKTLYEYAINRGNFSGYVKGLIERDLKRKEGNNGGIKIDLR